MIRKKSFNIIVLAVVAVFLVGTPVLVHADIFIKPNKSQNENAEPKKKKSFRSFFVNRFKKKTRSKSGSVTYHRRSGQDSKVVYRRSAYKAPPVDSALLSQAGREPRTVEELKAVASAHKATKLEAMRYMRALNEVAVANKMAQYEQQAAIMQARRERAKFRQSRRNAYKTSSPGETSQTVRTKRKVYVAPSSRNAKKPSKVFNRIR